MPVTSTDVAAPGTADSARPRVHFPCLEGLRALAALMVVAHHASSLAGSARTPQLVRIPAEVMDGGVAVFFVLSGFLIYRPIAAAHQSGDVPAPWPGFLWRRLLRLVPAYWLALSFFWALGSFDLGADWWRYYLFLQIYSRTTALGGLVQAWSLSTEVTFYLMIPLWSILHRAVRRIGLRQHQLQHLNHPRPGPCQLAALDYLLRGGEQRQLVSAGARAVYHLRHAGAQLPRAHRLYHRHAD